MAAPATSSAETSPPPTPPFTAPIPVHVLENDLLHRPQPHHLAHLSDIYLLPCSASSPCPHPPTCDALASSARIRLHLDRLPATSLPADLDAAVAAFEHPSITSGFALRVTGTTRASRASVAKPRKSTTLVLVAGTEALRDDWLKALRLQLAPASMILAEIIAVARGHASYGVIAHDARRALAQVSSGAETSLSVTAPATDDGDRGQIQDRVQGQVGQAVVEDETAGAVLYAERAIELVKRGGASSNFSTTCLQALHDVVSVGDIDTLSRSFGGVALVGPVLIVAGFIIKSLMMLSLAEAELPKLVSMRGMIEVVARKLFVIAYDIVVNSLTDGNVLVEEFVEDVLDAFVGCAELAADVEKHILHKRIWRARHVEDVEGLLARLAGLEISLKFSRHAKFATGLQAQFALFQTQIGDRLDRFENLEQDNAARINTCIAGVEELKAQLASANVGEAYSPVFYRVPKVPQHVVHDGIPQLEPLLDVLRSGGGVTAVSGELPAQSSTASNSSVSSYENAHSLATHGWGGVGKTLACIIAARDKTVRTTFSGGVVFLKFGEQVMDADVVAQLRAFVIKSGGGPEGKRIVEAIDKIEPTKTQVARVVGLVADWVEGRRVLFIADNLFHRAHGLPWAEELAVLAESPGSALLYSTRRRDLAEFASPQQLFAFECVKDPATAREIFFGYAGLERNEPVRDAVQSATIDLILSTCAGWHLALKMAGMLVRTLGCDWAKVKERMENHFLLKLKLPEGGVGVIMSVSLKLLGELPADGLEGLDVPLSAFENPDYFERIYRTLAVLSKVKSVPLPLLPLVFGVAPEDSESLARLFHDAGLATVEKSVEFDSGEGNHDVDKMFYLHDLQLQFASDLCASSSVPDESLASQHWLFLSQCCTIGTGARLPVAEHNWSMFCSAGSTPRDRYIRKNLFWHLAAAFDYRPTDVKAVVLFILSDFAWLRSRICADGFMSVVWDIKIALDAEETCRFTDEQRRSLAALRQVVMEMGGSVSLEFDGTFASALIQRAGRMSDRADSVFPDAAFSKRLAESAEGEVRGAWLKPLRGCSREFKSDARVLERVNFGTSGPSQRSLLAVAGLGDDKHVVSAGTDGEFGRLRVHKNEDLDSVLDWNGRCSMIRAIAVASNACDGMSFTIFSGGEDEGSKGCVRFWEIVVDAAGVPRLGEEGVVGECGEFVRTLSVSDDGLRLAAGCRNGLVFIWDRVNTHNKYAFNLLSSFLCGASHRIWTRERSWVRVAVSSSGSWVVAGTWAGDICFWEDRGLESEGTLVRVASTRPWESDGKLQTIVFNDGDSSAVVFFTFPAGFEIWNLLTKSLCAPRKTLDGLDSLDAVDVTSAPMERKARGVEMVDHKLSQTRFLVAAGNEEGGQNVLLEFDSLTGGDCVASYDIKTQAYAARYVTIGGARRAVAACRSGALLLLDVSDNSLRGMDKQEDVTAFLDMEIAGDAEWSLAKVCAVAVLPKRGIALAGHKDGSLSMWCAKSGNCKGMFEKANAKQVLCLDVSEDENMVVSGHAGGNIIVWHVDHWDAGLVMHANARGIISLTISADDSRIISVDEVGDVRSWDAMVGGDSAWVVSSALGFSGIKYIAHKKRACRPAISRDGKLFVWAMRGSTGGWMAKLIDVRDGGEVKSMTDVEQSDGFGFYRFIADCLERDGVKIGLGWRFGASIWGRFIELQTEADGEGMFLKISPGGIMSNYPPVLRSGGSCVRCFLETATLSVLRDAEFDFGMTTGSFAAGWMPQDGNESRQVVVACWIAHSNRPAILHYIPAKI